MIHHLLLIQRRDDLSEPDKQRFGEVVDSLGTIDGVLDLTWGEDFSGRAGQYTHGAVLRFENRETLAAYQNDPIHRAAVQTLDELAPNRLVLDYDTGTSIISAP